MKKGILLKSIASIFSSVIILCNCSNIPNHSGNIVDVTDESPIVEIQEASQLTLMVYMAADNDLESEALANLKQMEHSDFDRMNVLVLLDRADEYDRTDGDWTDTRLFKVCHDATDSNYIVSERLECPILGLRKDVPTELDMANYSVLRNFITFAKTEYEAEKYALIIWGHGTGWRYVPDNAGRAVSIDDKTNTYMSVLNEGKALKDMGISVVGFDTCFGGTIENLYELKADAAYTVASPSITPSSGWNYTSLLENLSASDFSEKEIALIMSESSSVSTSVYDNSKILDVFNKFELFSKNLSCYISSNETREEVFSKILSAKSYSYLQYPCDMFVDIYSLTDVFANFSDTAIAQSALDLQVELMTAGKTTNSNVLLIGVFFNEKTASQTLAMNHPYGYMKDQNNPVQCSFIKESVWWVPTVMQSSDSLIDKIFYRVYQ